MDDISTLKGLYNGLNFDPNGRTFHPLVNSLIISIQFILAMSLSPTHLVLLLTFVIFELILLKFVLRSINLLRGILPLLVMVGFFSLLFGGPERSFMILLRIILGSIIFSIFFTTTNPSDLSKMLEKLKIPHKFAIIPALSMSLLPRAIKDANETFETLLFRGVIKGSFFRWMPKTLSILIASSLYRSEFIAESLYIRNFGNKERRVYLERKFTLSDIGRLLFWFVIIIGILLLY